MVEIKRKLTQAVGAVYRSNWISVVTPADYTVTGRVTILLL